MKKNNSHLLAITILFLLPILLVGCNKNTVQGGAEIGYPYSCSISGNGTVTVKLDGSASPDYTWYASSDDVAVVTVSKKGMETNGKATFKITPVSEGDTSVTFIRERETTATTDLYEYATSEELASYESEISGTTKDAVATVMKPESEPESDENVIPVPESSDTEAINRVPKDRVCLITISITVTSNGKKFSSAARTSYEDKLDPIINDTGEGIPYQIWQDDAGVYRLNLPRVAGGWLVSDESEYTGTSEELVDPETGAVLGYTGDTLKTDEKGNPIIIETYDMGGIGDVSYKIVPQAQGKGTLYFSAPQEKKRLEIQFETGNESYLTILSHSIVSYEPSNAELKETVVDDDYDGQDEKSHLRDDSDSYEEYLQSLNSETPSDEETDVKEKDTKKKEAKEGDSEKTKEEESVKPSEPEPVSEPTSNVFNG